MPNGSKTYVYIDGFNLYYGALKGTKYRWLNIQKLCINLFPKCEIRRIKYFTARVKTEGSSVRQDVYLRAVKTLNNVDVIEGSFLKKNKRYPLANGRGAVNLKTFEEKGSDVNLGANLVHDAHLNRFETAVVITNDSDLVTPIRIVTADLGIPVIVALPVSRDGRNPSKRLSSEGLATSCLRLRRDGPYRESQFEPVLTDGAGRKIRCPPEWL